MARNNSERREVLDAVAGHPGEFLEQAVADLLLTMGYGGAAQRGALAAAAMKVSMDS